MSRNKFTDRDITVQLTLRDKEVIDAALDMLYEFIVKGYVTRAAGDKLLNYIETECEDERPSSVEIMKLLGRIEASSLNLSKVERFINI